MRAQTCASGRKRARKAPAVRYKDEFDAATSEDEVLHSDDDNESVTRRADSKRARRQLDEDFTSSGHQQMRRQQMKDAFQPWVMQVGALFAAVHSSREARQSDKLSVSPFSVLARPIVSAASDGRLLHFFRDCPVRRILFAL